VLHFTARRALLASAAGFALMLPAVAAAQDGSVPRTPAQASQGVANAETTAIDGLSDIVVTAERREENIQDVPLSVTAVAGEDLRTFQSGGEDILALAGRVPGLYAETTTGRIFPRFYIRGLGNIDFYLGASQPVSIIQDDVVLEHVVLKSNPMFDVAQVEVLRGPQGSLFGRNTTAGIIKFDTVRPGQEYEGRLNLSIGSYDTVTVDAGVGGPLVRDKIAFRVSGLMQRRSDWVDNVNTGPSLDGTIARDDAMGGFTERDARLQLLFTPSEAVSLLLSGHVRDYEGTSTIFHRDALRRGSNSIADEPRDTIALDEGQNNVQAYKMQGASAHLGLDLGFATLTSITAYEHASGYSRGDTDGGVSSGLFPINNPANGYGQSQGNLRDLDQLSEEVRLASDGDTAFKWQVGGIWFQSKDTTEFYQRAFFLDAPYTNSNNWVRLANDNYTWALFGQASYDLTDRLTLTAGGRYTKDTKRTQLLKPTASAAGVATFTGDRNVRLSDEQPSWDVSLNYAVDPDVNVYARHARGFRGPTIQGRSAVFNAPFTTADSEKNTSWELGFKSTLFDNTLRLNGAGFYYTVTDIQLNGNDSFGNGVLFNADKARGYGVELEADWRPVRNLSIGLGASALHTEIKDDRVFAQTCGFNGVQTCTVLDPFFTRGTGTGRTYFASIDGNPLPNAPKWNIDFTARYDLPLSNGGGLFAATDWNIQGYTNLVLYRTEEFYADGNLEGGLKIGYRTPDDKLEVAAFARNITDEKNLKGVIENYNAAVFNEPRIIGLSLSMRSR
jgi:iron complex outermembrane receptor protein